MLQYGLEFIGSLINFPVRRLCREQHPDQVDEFKGHVHICSRNNFPTAAGLASSAAGYACLGKSFLCPADGFSL